MKAALLSLGYGVTQIRGPYKEFGQSESQEESLFVVNLKDDPKFKKNLFKLSGYYNQDSFMYSPKGSDEGILIGTNNADFLATVMKFQAETLKGMYNQFL